MVASAAPPLHVRTGRRAARPRLPIIAATVATLAAAQPTAVVATLAAAVVWAAVAVAALAVAVVAASVVVAVLVAVAALAE